MSAVTEIGRRRGSGRGRGRPRNDDDEGRASELLRQVAAGEGLDRAGPTPLWVQIKTILSDQINRGILVPNMRLPSEQALGEIFAVSRPVVRSTMAGLASDGLVMKVPRTGIFVSPPRSETNFLTSNVSVHSDLEARGHEVTSETFLFERCSPDDAEARVFCLPPDGTVIRVGRVYRSDGLPITHTQISLPGHRVPGMEAIDITGRSIFQILKERYGLVSRRAERWFTAAMPDAEVARRLKVERTHPLISIESIAYDTDNFPLEYYRAFYNSAVSRIHVSTGTFSN